MFTGIVEAIGVVGEIAWKGAVMNLGIRSAISPEMRVDDSVAHDGVCLTVVDVRDDIHTVQLVKETLDRTSFRDMTTGRRLNLERSLPATGRIEGHIVQGHVDCLATCITADANGFYAFNYPRQYAALLTEKGSICVNGISLTVTKVDDETFSVALIPHTLEKTTFHEIQPGSLVNLEFDIIAKYLIRMYSLRQ